MITALFLTILLFFIAGCFEGVMDYLQFHYQGDNAFWNPLLSWVNKWNDGDPLRGERFMFSSTLFVALTDGWHLMKLLRNVTLFTGAGFLISLPEVESLLGIIVCAVGLRGAYGIGFVLMYEITLPGFSD